MKTSLRSQLRSNLVFPQSGFALINSIMSLFDVELNKTLRGRTSAASGLRRATVWESDIGGNLLKDAGPANQLIPLLILQLLSFLASPPSVNGLHLGRVFLVSCPLPWKPVTSFLTVCHLTHAQAAHPQRAVPRPLYSDLCLVSSGFLLLFIRLFASNTTKWNPVIRKYHL